MDLELRDKVAVVTGASKGIDRHRRGSRACGGGAKVVAGARHAEALEDLEGVSAIKVDLLASAGVAGVIDRGLIKTIYFGTRYRASLAPAERGTGVRVGRAPVAAHRCLRSV
jgi:NAD(P)-dependent dehydrogenase (short-subunit alcohol dehydrogenase family)